MLLHAAVRCTRMVLLWGRSWLLLQSARQGMVSQSVYCSNGLQVVQGVSLCKIWGGWGKVLCKLCCTRGLDGDNVIMAALRLWTATQGSIYIFMSALVVLSHDCHTPVLHSQFLAT